MKKTDSDPAKSLAALFTALSDATRLRLLNLMSEGEVCVCFFVEVLDQAQPAISRHLAFLRKSGLVAGRRDGKWIHYRITPPSDPAARRAFEAAMAALRSDKRMQRDQKNLHAACCSPAVSEILRRAPKPSLAPRRKHGATE